MGESGWVLRLALALQVDLCNETLLFIFISIVGRQDRGRTRGGRGGDVHPADPPPVKMCKSAREANQNQTNDRCTSRRDRCRGWEQAWEMRKESEGEGYW